MVICWLPVEEHTFEGPKESRLAVAEERALEGLTGFRLAAALEGLTGGNSPEHALWLLSIGRPHRRLSLVSP